MTGLSNHALLRAATIPLLSCFEERPMQTLVMSLVKVICRWSSSGRGLEFNILKEIVTAVGSQYGEVLSRMVRRDMVSRRLGGRQVLLHTMTAISRVGIL